MQNNLWNWQESKAETEEQEAPEGVEEDMNFALPLKKKKKKKVDFTMIENEDSEKPSDGTAIKSKKELKTESLSNPISQDALPVSVKMLVYIYSTLAWWPCQDLGNEKILQNISYYYIISWI